MDSFSDLCSGQIWALRDAQDEPEVRLLLGSELMPVGLTPDHRGEILVVDGPRSVWRLHLPAAAGPALRPARPAV